VYFKRNRLIFVFAWLAFLFSVKKANDSPCIMVVMDGEPPSSATPFSVMKQQDVIGLLWLFVNSSPIALMEQLKNVPSMFHQN